MIGSRLRSVALTVGSLMLVSALAGCAGSSWQFWKTSSSTETPSEPTVGTSASTPVAAATPPAPPTAMPAPPASDFAELPELPDVRFKPGLVTIGKADAAALDSAVRWLKAHPDSLVRVEGHSDDLGTPAANLVVAEKRAVSVMKYLVSKGLEPSRISVVSYGSDRPVCMEKNATCRAKNRRASILVKQP